MRVAIVTSCFLDRDGVGNTIRDLTAALAEWGWQGHVWMEPGDRGPDSALVRRVELGELLEAAAEGRNHAFFDYDVWVVVYLPHYPLLEVCRFLPPDRVVVEYPGVTPPSFYPPEDPLGALVASAPDDLDMLDDVAAVMVHSASMQRELSALRTLQPHRIRCLSLAVGESFAAGPASAELRKRLNPEGGPILLYVGRLTGNKRVDVLLRMVARVKRLSPTLRLVIAGMHERSTTPVYRRDLTNLSAELGIADSVVFVEGLSDDELAEYYRVADLFVTASLHEGFCLPVAESLACGTPCVVPALSATPETMGGGGVTCPPDDPAAMADVVAAILDDPVERGRLAAAARTEAERFAQPRYRRELRSLFDEVLAGPRPARFPDAEGLMSAAATTAPMYRDGLQWPVLGRVMRWLRRVTTLPLEVSCVRPTARQQTLWNRLMLQELRRLRNEVRDLKRRLRQEIP